VTRLANTLTGHLVCGGSGGDGTRIDIGVDTNGDGLLEPNEITQTVFLCGSTCVPGAGFPKGLCRCGQAVIACDGSCSASPPPLLDRPCGQCGGTVQCDGTCSIGTPPNLGASCDGPACGPCGCSIRCDGSCTSNTPPANLGGPCGSCGGTVQCDGSCAPATPSNYGATCGLSMINPTLACGSIQCNGICNAPLSSAWAGQTCPCGGTVPCSGSCSGVPGNYGSSCAGGTLQCDGSCTAASSGCLPMDYSNGAVTVTSSPCVGAADGQQVSVSFTALRCPSTLGWSTCEMPSAASGLPRACIRPAVPVSMVVMGAGTICGGSGTLQVAASIPAQDGGAPIPCGSGGCDVAVLLNNSIMASQPLAF